MPFWDDLEGGSPLHWHDTANDRVINSWEGVDAVAPGASSGVSFQVHLYPDGTIEFHYWDVIFGSGPAAHDSGASATVGITDNAGGTGQLGNYLEYSCNAGSLTSFSAVAFTLCEDGDGDGETDEGCGDDDDGADDDDDAGPDDDDASDDDDDASDDDDDASGDDDDDASDDDDDDDGCFDCDGDGYGDDVDCDDQSSAVHPGADEVEDGLDNDGDGEIDEIDETSESGGCSSAGATPEGPIVAGVILAFGFRLRRRGGRP